MSVTVISLALSAALRVAAADPPLVNNLPPWQPTSAPTTAGPGAPTATGPGAPVPAAPPSVTIDSDEAQAPWVILGLVDTQYAFNSNLPDNHIFRGTSVSARTGEFNPQLMVVGIRRDPIRSPWMMELALQAGSAADALYAAEPVAGGDAGRYAGAEVFKHIGRAWAGVKLKRGTEIAAGLMVAPTHFGSFWTKDNWHASITWGYQSVPFFLAGVRVWQPITDRLGIGAWLATGYGYMGDVNKAPSGLINLVFSPIRDLNLVQNVYAGPEDVDMRPEAWRLLVDSQVIYNTDRWGIAVVGDYGRERLTFRPDKAVAHWANGMVSVRWHMLGEKHKWGMAVRPEFFWDFNGRFYGAPDRSHWMFGGTLTNDVRLFDALLVRVEYRYDRSTAANGYWYRLGAITDDAAGLARDQHTVILSFNAYFERRLLGLRH